MPPHSVALKPVLQNNGFIGFSQTRNKAADVCVCQGMIMVYLCFSPAARAESTAFEGIATIPQGCGALCRLYSQMLPCGLHATNVSHPHAACVKSTSIDTDIDPA